MSRNLSLTYGPGELYPIDENLESSEPGVAKDNGTYGPGELYTIDESLESSEPGVAKDNGKNGESSSVSSSEFATVSGESSADERAKQPSSGSEEVPRPTNPAVPRNGSTSTSTSASASESGGEGGAPAPAADIARPAAVRPTVASATQTPTRFAPSASRDVPPRGLEFAARVRQLPAARCASGVYAQAKAQAVLAGPLVLAECVAWTATRPLALAAAPVSGLCGTPVAFADWLLCRGLDAAQTIFPCIAVHPGQMCGASVACVRDCVCYCPKLLASTAGKICTTKETAN